MSGHSEFNSIGIGNVGQGNYVAPIMNEPLAGAQGPVVQGGQQQQPVALPNQQGEQAARIASKLDVLLLKVAASATKDVDAAGMKTLAKDAKLNKTILKDIDKAAKDANAAFHAIDRFSGREIAATMVKDDKTGAFKWAENNAAATAIQDAQDKLAALSSKLAEAINNLPPNARAGVQERLEDAMMRIDRRMAQMESLICEFAEMAEKAGDDPAIAARLDKALASLIPSESLKMHGAADVRRNFGAALTSLATKIDNLATQKERGLSGAEMTQIRRELDEAAAAFDHAPSCESVDKNLLASAKTELAAIRGRFDAMKKETLITSLKNFSDKAFTVPTDPILDPKFQPIMKKMIPNFYTAIETQKMLKAEIDKAAANPAAFKENKIKALADALKALVDPIENETNRLVNIHGTARLPIHKFVIEQDPGLDNYIAKLPEDERKVFTPQVRDEFRNALLKFIGEDFQQNLAPIKAFGQGLDGRASQIEHFCNMIKTTAKMDEAKFTTNKTLDAVFQGKMAVSTVVETRINGLPDEDADPEFDDSNVVAEKRLGSGAVNTVVQVDYKNGSTFVFKPEIAGREMMERLNLAHEGYKDQQMVAQLNMATQKTSEALGLDDVLAKTSVGSHNGTFGLFMEKAKGVEAKKFSYGAVAGPDSMNIDEIKNLDDDKYAKVVGDIMRKTNRLEWADILTGQGDRHGANYLIDVSKAGKVSLKGIDNDMCFSDYMIGVRKFRLTGTHAEHFQQKLEELAAGLYYGDAQEDELERLLNDPGVKRTKNGDFILDASKFQAKELHGILGKTIGIHGTSTPKYMDEDFYNHLMTLKSGPDREKYIADLNARLPPASAKAAVGRLNDLIQIAEQLKADNKVLSEDDWHDHDIQRQIAGKRQAASKDDPNKPVFNHPFIKIDGETPKLNQVTKPIAQSAYNNTQGLFRRDILFYIAKPGWFDQET